MIEVKNLTKVYGAGDNAVVAVKDVSFSVLDGEFIAITGKSGSGKTSLMHLLGGLEQSTKGSILFDGADITQMTEKELTEFRSCKTGFVFQSFYLESSFSVFDNVRIPLLIRGVPFVEHEKRIMDVLEKVGLSQKRNSKIFHLSGGQKQRVAIARALVNQGQYIFADEPCGNLDSENGMHIMELLKSLHKEGRTIILVTHNEDDAKKADRIIRLKDGEIIK